MRRTGIERQTQLVALLPILVIAVLLESYFIYSRFNDLDAQLLERSQLLTRQLASASEYAVFSGNSALLKRHVDSALASQDVQSITILDAAFHPLLKAGNKELKFVAQHSAIPQLDQNMDMLRLYEPITATQIKLDDGYLGGETTRIADQPLGMVVVEFSKARMNKQKTEIGIFNILITLIVFSVASMMALRIARRISQPILGMHQAIMKIGTGELHTRIASPPEISELHDLADGVNRMASQLQMDRNLLQERINQATFELRTQKEEAESSSFSKTRFLAAASHDLRQPIHALGLFIGELQTTVTSDNQRKIVMKVEESVDALSGLLNSLLDISKLDAGVIVPQLRDFNIELILGRIAQDYRPLAQSKSIKLHVSPCVMDVRSDPILLERILVNLVSNALRYTPIGGRIMLGCRIRGNNLRIEVRDNGIGIPLDEQKNIFLEFVQLANKERDRNLGLGLGLAIVERLSRLLQHPVSVRSDLGMGSMFTIEIPLTSNSEKTYEDDHHLIEAQVSTDQLINKQANPKLLVVDDDPLVRSSTQGILSSWGYRVYLAASLQDVKSKFNQQSFDLIICDYRLPDGTGLDVVNFLALIQQKFTACILISGDTSPDILQKAAESGFNLLSKPVRPAKLRSLINFLLNESQHSELP